MRVSFIGTGGIARRHAEGLVKMSDITVAGACDLVPERAEAFCGQFGGQPYTDVAQLLDESKPDALWICLPPYAHGEAELAALERRIPFLVEKPVANSLATARAVLERVEASGVLAVAGYMNRYRRGVARARALLADDPPILVHGGWVGGTPGVPWWRSKAQSGGQIVEQTTHIFDLARYLVGEPEVVCAQGTRGFVQDMPGYDVEDASVVAVHFCGGAVGSLVSSCAGRTGGGGVHLSVTAAHHQIDFTGWESAAVIQKSPLEKEQIAGEANIFEIEDAAFLQAVASGDRSGILSPYADAVYTLAFTLAANLALETGRPVRVSEM